MVTNCRATGSRRLPGLGITRMIAIITAVLIIQTSVLAACTSSEKEAANTGTAPASGTAKQVTLSFLRTGNDKAEADYWKALITEFESENPGVTVNYDDAAIGEAMETKLNSLFVSGTGPDIIGYGILSVAQRVELGHYLPVTEYFEKWEGREDIMPSVLANGTYKDEVYGLAYSTTPFIFAYRKDLFEKEGLDPEKPPQTWDELKTYAEKLTKKENGVITTAGFAFPMSAGNFVEFDVFVFGNGGRYYQHEDSPELNTEEVRNTFEYLMSFLPGVNIPYSSSETNPFIKGLAAMTLINNVALRPMLENEEYKGKIGVAVPPWNTEKATFCGCNMLFMGRDCKNKDEAWDFIEKALTKEQVLKRSNDLNVPVVLKSLTDEFTAMDPYNAQRAECVAVGIGMPRTVWSVNFQKLRNEMVEKVLYSKMSISEAVEEAQAKLLEEIKP